jgi:hypothetical protein
MSGKYATRFRFSLLFSVAVLAMVLSVVNRQGGASSIVQQHPDASAPQGADAVRRKTDIERAERTRATIPKVEYESALSTRVAESAHRFARAKHYNGKDTAFIDLPKNVGAITYERESLGPPLPALPGDQADVVAKATVTDAKAYLSEDRSGAYSEYSISVTETFKGGDRVVGGQLTVERIGARVILPDGRTILYWDTNLGTPEVGHDYVLFLKYNTDRDDYELLTAYQIRAGLVTPLDRPEQFAVFDGNDADKFLDLVRSRVR